MSAYVAVTLYGGDKSQMLHSSAYARLVEHLFLYQIWYAYKTKQTNKQKEKETKNKTKHVFSAFLFVRSMCVYIKGTH